MKFGLKLGSENINYTEAIFSLYRHDYFHYIELFAIPGSLGDTIDYWKQFDIPFVIHAPHSMAGMNLSIKEHRKINKEKLWETFRFADSLNAEYIIFHPGVNGVIKETINQLMPFVDIRCLIENKPRKGLNNEGCIGSTFDELAYIINELKVGFCLDFGHAICAANSFHKDQLQYIKELLLLKPSMYHLTDGDYHSEYDSHLHYGKGNFPIRDILKLIPGGSKITDEAKHNSDDNLEDFKEDMLYATAEYLRRADYSDMELLYQWANDPETRANSISSESIIFDEHKRWFKEKLNDANVLFFIFHDGKQNIGQVRIDIKENTAIINYSIAPSFRGKGYGYRMMRLAEKEIQYNYPAIKWIQAEVKYKNKASQYIFRKLNYTESQDSYIVKFIKALPPNRNIGR
jgi:RimJ/RimL family protein N-acetyltransferase